MYIVRVYNNNGALYKEFEIKAQDADTAILEAMHLMHDYKNKYTYYAEEV